MTLERLQKLQAELQALRSHLQDSLYLTSTQSPVGASLLAIA
jgi:hypothetical protein